MRMQISLDGQSKTERSVLALGMFDGVHLGHRVLLQRAHRLARRLNAPLVACTFTTHPMALIAPEKTPPMLTTLEERARLMEAQEVSLLCAQPFDEKTMNQSPEAYIAELCKRFHPQFIVVGYNFTFGKAGAGNPALLRALGEVFGFSVEVVPQITLNGQEISSSVVRALLGKGEVSLARRLLGHAYGRQAVVAGHRGERVSLVMPPNGKQDVPEGSYRVIVETDGKILPALLRVQRSGRGEARLPAPLAMAGEADIRFYARQPKSELGI